MGGLTYTSEGKANAIADNLAETFSLNAQKIQHTNLIINNYLDDPSNNGSEPRLINDDEIIDIFKQQKKPQYQT